MVALVLTGSVSAQTTVDVTFRYKPPAGTAAPYYVVGEFNGWVNNQLTLSPGEDGFYERSVSLPVGGFPAGRIAGAVEYKFYYPGASSWPSDPLNPRTNPAENNNSVLFIQDPTIYHFLPNETSGIVRTSRPVISAFIFPAQGSAVDTGAISLRVDNTIIEDLGAFYDPVRKQLRYSLPWDLQNGTHRAWITTNGIMDSVSFSTQSGFVQITNRPGFTTRKQSWTLFGIVEDTTRSMVRMVRNGVDTTEASISGGSFTLSVPLDEGENVFVAVVTDTLGQEKLSDPFSVTRHVDHTPFAIASVSLQGAQIAFDATSSTDPDGDITSYRWEEIPGNPESLPSFHGSTSASLTIALPGTPGEYLYTLIATDSAGNKDTTRQFFRIVRPDSLVSSTYATIPQWAIEGRMYSLFFKAFTPEGTINAARPYLPYLQQLGVNVIWVLPVMENAFPINNSEGPGYNIKNLFKVAPEYGTNADFAAFISDAHTLGIRVILDVTPNHTSFAHPFVADARTYGEASPYWNFYVHTIIPHNDNDLGQSLTNDGFNYYSGFSDQLLNYDWADLDARQFMIGVYDWWIREFDLDGYRYDVYWGPRRRTNNGIAGEEEMGYPTRVMLKHRKADIFLLAEDGGTGFGTEAIYADHLGGVDAGYDWSLYHDAVRSFGFTAQAVNTLYERLSNNGYVPGPNAKFLRFLENHDEDRIAYLYGDYAKTKPVATSTLLAPGMPLIYAGQEVGWGLGISNFDQRRRGVIDWEHSGRSILLTHYQRLFQIRRQFRAFDGQQLRRVATSSPSILAYTRPLEGEDAIVVTNMSSVTVQTTLAIPSAVLGTTLQNGTAYVVSDVYTDSSQSVIAGNAEISITVTIPAYGSYVGIIASEGRELLLPSITSVHPLMSGSDIPTSMRLYQNYPNPFNPSTTIRYDLPLSGNVSLVIYNAIGQEVARLVEGHQHAGTHEVAWRANAQTSSGLYVARLVSSQSTMTLKLMYLR